MRLLLILVIDGLVGQILILCPVSDIAPKLGTLQLACYGPLSPDVRFGSILLKKGSHSLANSDSVSLRFLMAEVCHDGSADGRSEPAILSIQP
jgi:hypothetical protein